MAKFRTLTEGIVVSFYSRLTFHLAPLYRVPNVLGGHDEVHVRGVEKLGETILLHLPAVDKEEYRVTAWLHNLDRCLALKQEVSAAGGLQSYLWSLLSDSPFDQDGRARIVDVVLQHGKKEDDLHNDPQLLTAIRVAEKLDRFTPLNMMAGPAHRSDLPHYDEEQPFGYKTNKPCHLKYFLWNVEWYGMLPYDWARELVDKDYFRLFLSFISEFGRDIAERQGIPNAIEDDIRMALGSYYEEWR